MQKRSPSLCLRSPWHLVPYDEHLTFHSLLEFVQLQVEVGIITTMAICQSKSMKLERGHLSLMRVSLK
jgi:hypothetical protein